MSQEAFLFLWLCFTLPQPSTWPDPHKGNHIMYSVYNLMIPCGIYELSTQFFFTESPTVNSYSVIVWSCMYCFLAPPLQAARRLQILEEMKQIASSDNNFKNYRDRLRTINPPCVPFVGEIHRTGLSTIIIINHCMEMFHENWIFVARFSVNFSL